jgi:hypothetical protein
MPNRVARIKLTCDPGACQAPVRTDSAASDGPGRVPAPANPWRVLPAGGIKVTVRESYPPLHYPSGPA